MPSLDDIEIAMKAQEQLHPVGFEALTRHLQESQGWELDRAENAAISVL